MSAEIIAHLLDEMEEYYGAFDYYPLYQFSAGISTTKPRTTRARSANWLDRRIDEFTSRHSTKVVWVPWPTDLEQADPLAPRHSPRL